jgi:hypothetical protein
VGYHGVAFALLTIGHGLAVGLLRVLQIARASAQHLRESYYLPERDWTLDTLSQFQQVQPPQLCKVVLLLLYRRWWSLLVAFALPASLTAAPPPPTPQPALAICIRSTKKTSMQASTCCRYTCITQVTTTGKGSHCLISFPLPLYDCLL